MATRFWFQSTGSPSISPNFDAGWEQTGSATRRPMTDKKQASTVSALTNSSAITIPITTTQQILAYQFISDQIFLPVRLDASVLFSMVVRCSENATTNNAFLAYVLRALGVDGSNTVLATLASSMTNAGTEFAVTASAATRIFGNGTTTVALTASSLLQPWRLCLEFGAHAQAPTAAGAFIQRIGCDNASDFALTSALTTNLNPWMELSVNLKALTSNNHKSIKAASGMSVGDRIR